VDAHGIVPHQPVSRARCSFFLSLSSVDFQPEVNNESEAGWEEVLLTGSPRPSRSRGVDMEESSENLGQSCGQGLCP
jgi:hypothetical protein